MSIEQAKIKEKLMRAAIRAAPSLFPENKDDVLKAIIELPDPALMNRLPQEARDWLLLELAKHPPMRTRRIKRE